MPRGKRKDSEAPPPEVDEGSLLPLSDEGESRAIEAIAGESVLPDDDEEDIDTEFTFVPPPKGAIARFLGLKPIPEHLLKGGSSATSTDVSESGVQEDQRSDEDDEKSADPLTATAEFVSNDGEQAKKEEPLTTVEKERLLTLEQEVEESALRAAIALREIRDSRLYRTTHGTFEEYCKERFGFVRSYSYQLIDAAVTSDNIRKRLRDADILPVNEYQLRPLAKLKDKPQIQAEIWERSVEKTQGRQPTYEAVKEALLEVTGDKTQKNEKPPKKPYTFKKDDVCIIRETDDELLKERKGYWAIIDEVAEDGTVTLSLYDRTAIDNIAPSALEPLPFKAEERRDRRKLLSRMSGIEEGLGDDDRMVRHMMAYFGKLREPTLTAVEKDVLRTLEKLAKRVTQTQGDGGEEEDAIVDS